MTEVRSFALSRLLFGRGLPRPWASWALLAGCLAATLPMAFDERLYLVLGADAPEQRWWHPLLTVFIHGGGPPGAALHLAVNGFILLLFGGLLERLLGHNRFLALTAACLATHVAVFKLWAGLPTQGISGVVFGYTLLAAAALGALVRANPRGALLDPLLWLAGLFTLAQVGATLVIGGGDLLTLLRGGRPERFGDLSHLLAFATTLPFLALWAGRTWRRASEMCGRG
jgi:membrane associated rhomboid family serine protease